MGYTFNWFYVDDKHIAYFNPGFNPVRAGTEPYFPVEPRFEWRELEPGRWRARATRAIAQHPQAINQTFIVELEQQAGARLPRGRRNLGYGSLYRSQSLLDDRIRQRHQGRRKMSLAAADRRDGERRRPSTSAATKVLPLGAEACSASSSDPRLRHAVAS